MLKLELSIRILNKRQRPGISLREQSPQRGLKHRLNAASSNQCFDLCCTPIPPSLPCLVLDPVLRCPVKQKCHDMIFSRWRFTLTSELMCRNAVYTSQFPGLDVFTRLTWHLLHRSSCLIRVCDVRLESNIQLRSFECPFRFTTYLYISR